MTLPAVDGPGTHILAAGVALAGDGVGFTIGEGKAAVIVGGCGSGESPGGLRVLRLVSCSRASIGFFLHRRGPRSSRPRRRGAVLDPCPRSRQIFDIEREW